MPSTTTTSRNIFADKLPVYRGDAGAYWEDGVASSAEATTWNRQTQQVLPVAETSASFATMFEPRYRYPARRFPRRLEESSFLRRAHLGRL